MSCCGQWQWETRRFGFFILLWMKELNQNKIIYNIILYIYNDIKYVLIQKRQCFCYVKKLLLYTLGLTSFPTAYVGQVGGRGLNEERSLMVVQTSWLHHLWRDSFSSREIQLCLEDIHLPTSNIWRKWQSFLSITFVFNCIRLLFIKIKISWRISSAWFCHRNPNTKQ